MPNPKKHHTASRRDKRRANWKVRLPSLSQCPQCGAAALPHRVCPSCGFYAGRPVITQPQKPSKPEATE
ncbi:MAG: 50S ribosomal protein L32 [Elusimicrobia bacterium]|nr:50S ribosomal protein L32 [Elusimicrobiota bacterium]